MQEEPPLKNPRYNINMHNLIVTPQELKRGIHHPHNDPYKITTQIGPTVVSKILVDLGSTVNNIFKHAFDQIHILGDRLELSPEPIFGFKNKETMPLGQIKLPVQIGFPLYSHVFETTFFVIDHPSCYNAFFKRPALDELDAFVSPKYLMVKFLTNKGWGTVKGEQFNSRELYFATIDQYKRECSAYFDASLIFNL